MAITTATLTAAITASSTQFGISNVSVNQSGLPSVGAMPLSVGNPMQIDGEWMYVFNQPVAGTVQVRGRGSDGTAATAHDVLANVSCSASPADFGNPGAGQTTNTDLTNDSPVAIGQDQTIVFPSANTVYHINKITAAAIVLTAPAAVFNGVVGVFTSTTAAAHVITATSLIMDGAGTVPKSTLTFVAKQGATVTLIAENGFLSVQALQNVVVS